MHEPFVFEKFFESDNIASYDPSDPVYKTGKQIGDEFSDLVDVMRQEKWLPLPSINKLMTLFWQLVGNKITPLAITNVSSLSFWAETRSKSGNLQTMAVILCPENWHDLLIKDPQFQMAALVFVASQAKDYWNLKILPNTKEDMKSRAWSYECELINYFIHEVDNYQLNEYQTTILGKFPNGIASCDLHYESRDYDGIFPPFPVS